MFLKLNQTSTSYLTSKLWTLILWERIVFKKMGWEKKLTFTDTFHVFWTAALNPLSQCTLTATLQDKHYWLYLYSWRYCGKKGSHKNINYLFLSAWTHGILFHSVGYNLLISLYILWLFPALTMGAPSNEPLCPFPCPHQFLSIPLLSGTTRYFKHALFLFLASALESAKEPWLLLLKNQVPVGLTEVWTLCVYICIYIPYTLIFIFFSISKYIKDHEFILRPLIPNHTSCSFHPASFLPPTVKN